MRIRWLVWSEWFVCLVFLLGLGSGGLSGQDLALVGGTLIDGTGNDPRPDIIVVIEAGKVSRVVPADTELPAGLTKIDARGKYLIPGLIDNHTHFRDWQVDFFLAYGVTTVLDLGNPVDWIQAIKEAIAKGKIKGPRLFRVGEILDAPPRPGMTEVPMERRGRLVYVKDAAEARAEVKRQVAAGVDCIKIYARLSSEQLAAIADEAHKANIPVAGHVRDAREAALAGIDFLEHTDNVAMSTIEDFDRFDKVIKERFLDPNYFGGVLIEKGLSQGLPPHHLMDPGRFADLTRLMVRQNSFLNPTLLVYWRGLHGRRSEMDRERREFLRDPRVDHIPLNVRLHMLDYRNVDDLEPQIYEDLLRGYERVKEFLKVFVQGGGKVVAGVDVTTHDVPGLGTHQEMALLVDAGLTPMQALLSATLWSAQMMKKADLFGSVEVGKLGDLVVLNENPLQDIRNSRSIDLVIKEGIVQDTEYRTDYSIPIPRPSASFFPNKTPELSEVTPRLAVEGAERAEIALRGHGFSRYSRVHFDGVRISTRYVSEEQLEASIPTGLLARVGTFLVTVQNPRPGGGVSNSRRFMVKFQ